MAAHKWFPVTGDIKSVSPKQYQKHESEIDKEALDLGFELITIPETSAPLLFGENYWFIRKSDLDR